MSWALVIYLHGWSVFGIPDRYEPFPDKESCYEALHELQKQPDRYKTAYCAPLRK